VTGQPVGCRSNRRRTPKRSVAGGFGSRGACRSRSAEPDGWFGACRSRSVPSGRVCGADRGRHRGTRGTMSLPAEAGGFIGIGCLRPAEAGRGVSVRCRRGRSEPPSDIPGRSGLASHRSGNGAGGPCPVSRRGSDPPKRTPTSPRWSRTREVRGVPAEAEASVPSRAPEFVAPFRGPRFQVPGSGALRGSGRLRGLAPLTSPLRCPTVSSGASPVSPMGLFPLRGPLPSAAVPTGLVRRSARVPLGPRPAEAAWVPWEGSSYRLPATRGVGPFPAASCEGGPQHPFVGCSQRPVRGLLPGLVSPRCPRSLSGSESREPLSVGWPSVAGRSSVGAVSPASMGFFTSKT
jgi:hypothetical protein